MHAIEFENITKRFPNATKDAVHDVSLIIEEGEFITILGSSGCGKTTLLKLVNRLYEPDKGRIVLFGEDTGTLDPILVRRRIGYVIQQIGLFPHMTVAENIATVPRLMEWDKGKIRDRVDELLYMIGLDPKEYRGRYPSQLSGGEQQRVGLARALAIDPKIMLLDEPFGALDSITRVNLQQELLRIHGGLHKTFLFVTHDIEEALTLGDRVIIMNEGKVLQFAPPEQIVRAPGDDFVASLVHAVKDKQKFWEQFQ